MPQDFYSLEQAAERLGVTADRMKEMARRNEVRSFTDRGTQRFRKQEIDELARQRGMGSDGDLQLADSKTQPALPAQGSDVFPFKVPEADTGVAVFPTPPGGAKQPPGSDNDVKLVPEGSSLELEVNAPGGGPSSSAINVGGSKKSRSGSGKLVTDADSDVKLVDENSVVNIGKDEHRPGSDSDVRLDELGSGTGLMPDSGVRLVDDRPPSSKARKADLSSPTEEINLDEELRRMEEALTPDARKALESTSPFELGKAPPSSAKMKKPPDSSSDFDFTAALPPRSDDSVELDMGMDLARDVTSGSGAGASGIDLAKPSDSGRSLTGSDEESITFELEPDAQKGHTPPRGQPQAKAEVDSSSEFELTLDDESSIAPMGSSSSNKPIQADKVLGLKGDDSGSDELRIGASSSGDLNLESSDFELALDEEPAQAGETGSEVIVIDEGAEEGEPTAVRPEALDALEAEEIAEIDEELSVEAAAEEGEVVPAGPVVEAAPAEWGWWSIIHLPTALVLLFVGFLLIEMLRSIWSYNQPTMVGSKIFEMFAGMLK
jgi:excisionase family DNA binding protein